MEETQNNGAFHPKVSKESREIIDAIAPLLVGMSPGKWSMVKAAVDQAFSEEKAKVTLADAERVTLLLECALS